MKTKHIFSLAMALIMITSCTEKIDVELDDTYTRLVVEGNLTNDTMAHRIILSKTSSYFYNQAAAKVSGASVKVTDNLGNSISFTEKEAGIYESPDQYFGVINRSYELQIDLEEEIGGSSRYEASSKLLGGPPIDSIRMEFNTQFGENGFWIVKLYALDPVGIENYYLFNVFRNGGLVTDTLEKVLFSDDQLFDGNYTYGIGVSFFDNSYKNQSFQLGDHVTLQLGGITDKHYTFLSNMSEATSFQNPLFGGPPANVVGNISQGGFGYFSAYSTTYSTIILSENNVDYVD